MKPHIGDASVMLNGRLVHRFVYWAFPQETSLKGFKAWQRAKDLVDSLAVNGKRATIVETKPYA